MLKNCVLLIFLFIDQSGGNPTGCKISQFLNFDGTCEDCHPYCMTCKSFGTSVEENACLCVDFIYNNSTHFNCVENCNNYRQNIETGELCQKWSELAPDVRSEFLKRQSTAEDEVVPLQTSRNEGWWIVVFFAVIAFCCFCCTG